MTVTLRLMTAANSPGNCIQIPGFPGPGLALASPPSSICRHVVCDCSAVNSRLSSEIDVVNDLT